MVGKGADNIGTSDAPYAIVFNTGDELVAGFFNGDGSGAALLGPTVRDTDFHHYAYARSGDTHKLFMDGRDATILTYESFSDGSEIIGNPSDPFTARPGDTSGLPFVIGAFRNGSDPTGFDFHFGGVIDEVEVFNRALSADEIRAIYEAGSAGKIKPPPPEPIPPPAGIVGWWPGDEDASDIVGGVNGTPQNGATFAPGLVGQAFSLDGSDDFVSLPDDAFDALFAGGEISIEAWMKTGGVASQSSDSKSGIAAAWDFTAVMFESSWWLYFDFAEIGVITAVWDGVWGNRLSSATFISDDNWHHVASTYSGGTARIYVDGVLRASEPRNLANGVTNRFSGGAFNNYPGLLDEITLYNRALTAEEIRAIYEAGSAGKIKPPAPEPIPPPAGMVSWWPGDGNANDIWDGNPGTLQGGAGFTPGMVDQAFSFDSDDDRVTIAHNPNLNVPPAGFTVDFWMRGSPSQPDSHFLVVDKSHGWVDSTGWVFQGISANGNLFFAIGAGGAGNTDFRGVESLASVLDNQFHYVAGTWDGGTIRLYVDSVLQGTAALEVPANNARPVNIAFSWGGGPPRRFFRGSVDEIGLFSRALTPEEIRAIYQAGSAGKIKPENTITLPNLGNRGYIFSTQELTGSGDADQDRDIWWNNVELVGSMQSLGVYPNLDSVPDLPETGYVFGAFEIHAGEALGVQIVRDGETKYAKVWVHLDYTPTYENVGQSINILTLDLEYPVTPST